MNMISSATSPYLLHAERSGKPRETYGNRFSDALEKEKAENGITESAVEIAVNEMDKARKEEAISEPSYTVTEEEAEFFREKYGEEYDEEKPYQLFYELVEKKIISSDDAAGASGISRIFSETMRQQGTWKESYSDYNCYGSYYDRFMGSYDKEINTWQDVAERQYDFWQYMINLDEKLVTPDGTYFQSSKEQMNVRFDRQCERILKVKDVLTQIFGE